MIKRSKNMANKLAADGMAQHGIVIRQGKSMRASEYPFGVVDGNVRDSQSHLLQSRLHASTFLRRIALVQQREPEIRRVRAAEFLQVVVATRNLREPFIHGRAVEVAVRGGMIANGKPPIHPGLQRQFVLHRMITHHETCGRRLMHAQHGCNSLQRLIGRIAVRQRTNPRQIIDCDGELYWRCYRRHFPSFDC